MIFPDDFIEFAASLVGGMDVLKEKYALRRIAELRREGQIRTFGELVDRAEKEIWYEALSAVDLTRLCNQFGSSHTEGRRAVLGYLREHPDGVPSAEIAEQLRMNATTVRSHLKTLVKKGQAHNETTGRQRRTTRWFPNREEEDG
jgi:DNA-binding Lrp family transcriptional regulator